MAICTHRNYISGDNASMIDTAHFLSLKAGEKRAEKDGCFCGATFEAGAYQGAWITFALIAENDIHTPEQFLQLFEMALNDPNGMNDRLQVMRGFFVGDESEVK